MTVLERNRKQFENTKRKPFFKRLTCKHAWLYIGIDNCNKVYFCKHCGKQDRR